MHDNPMQSFTHSNRQQYMEIHSILHPLSFVFDEKPFSLSLAGFASLRYTGQYDTDFFQPLADPATPRGERETRGDLAGEQTPQPRRQDSHVNADGTGGLQLKAVLQRGTF